jgi:glycosyl transferase family 2
MRGSVMAQSTLAKRPLVSVVTPFFNTAPYLAECIESVLAQSYSHFEYILMDNCSTDGSTELPRLISSRVNVDSSFRGACAACEPGIQAMALWILDSGFAALRRPGMTSYTKSLNF